jgi:hypothetical protein
MEGLEQPSFGWHEVRRGMHRRSGIRRGNDRW